MDEKELQHKFQSFEQQIQLVQQQLQSVEQAIQDITLLSLGFDEIKKDKEIMAPLGRGIFAKAKLISEDLTVDIGEGKYVKKSIKDTKELIQEQVKKLEQVKKELNLELENINQELTQTFMASQHNHEHCEDENCEH